MNDIDIHTHILSDIDDGAWDPEESDMLAIGLYLQGVRHIFATPHSLGLLSNPRKAKETFETLKKRVEPLLSLHLGCEVFCEAEQMQNIIACLKDGTLPTMNGTRHVLVEFSPDVSRKDLWDCLRDLKDAGFVPILAHYERYHALKNDCHEAGELKRQTGCLLQLNATSLMAMESGHEWAGTLIQKKLIDMLGSDCHKTTSTPPHIGDAREYLKQHSDEVYSNWVLRDCAYQKLVKGAE